MQILQTAEGNLSCWLMLAFGEREVCFKMSSGDASERSFYPLSGPSLKSSRGIERALAGWWLARHRVNSATIGRHYQWRRAALPGERDPVAKGGLALEAEP